jgi:hypothetical protein
MKPKVALSQDLLANLANSLDRSEQGSEVGDPLPERTDLYWNQL